MSENAIGLRRGVECLPIYCDDMMSRYEACSSRYVHVKSVDVKKSSHEAQERNAKGKLGVVGASAASPVCKATSTAVLPVTKHEMHVHNLI